MSAWNISAIYKNVSAALERSFNSYQTVQSVDTVILLREVDKILQSTRDLLPLLTSGEYESFKAQHRTYQWMCHDEKRQYENVEKQTLEQRFASQKLVADKEACQTRVSNLLEALKTYRSKLLEASRRAAVGSISAFPDEEPMAAASQPAENGPLSPPPPNLPTPSPNVSVPSRPIVAPSLGTSSLSQMPKIPILPTSTLFSAARGFLRVNSS
ncbi:hypothetical protein FRC10_004500 [Ceratobasidium sp. 414]|nr:hypothetical protein FRC10_004500 [Ceratobasidium sp. 414]